LNKHNYWFIGLSGSGKTTLAKKLKNDHLPDHVLLDGDNVREYLNKDLGFSMEDRVENLRRIRAIVTILNRQGIYCIVSFITPAEVARVAIRDEIPLTRIIYLECPLKVCEARDVKGMYKKARAGLIKDFTGIDSPFEEPFDPDLVINTNTLTIEESIECILETQIF
jgi:adenylylsulfate kinase